MKKLVSLLTVFALVLLSACAWWSEPDPDNMRDETLWALSSPETLQTVFPDTAATGEEQDGFLPVGTVNYESRVEEKRPGEYFPVFEDEKGTYIMNSRDMCMIDHLAELAEAGVDCIKVEGRAKSAYYAAIITGAYRHALDAVAAGEPVDPVWRDEVEHVSHRRYSTGFFFGQPGQYTESSRYIRDWQVCAIVTDCTPDGLATLSLRNKFAAGDEVEIVGPDTRPFSVTVPVMQDADGLPLREPRTPQMVFRMQLPRPVPAMSIVRRAVDLSAK